MPLWGGRSGGRGRGVRSAGGLHPSHDDDDGDQQVNQAHVHVRGGRSGQLGRRRDQ